MKLTGRCKADFKKWYLKNCYDAIILLEDFYDLHPSMQYGVYVDYFDSVGIEICLVKNCNGFFIELKGDLLIVGNDEPFTRQEAREIAITKANEIHNKNN